MVSALRYHGSRSQIPWIFSDIIVLRSQQKMTCKYLHNSCKSCKFCASVRYFWLKVKISCWILASVIFFAKCKYFLLKSCKGKLIISWNLATVNTFCQNLGYIIHLYKQINISLWNLARTIVFVWFILEVQIFIDKMLQANLVLFIIQDSCSLQDPLRENIKYIYIPYCFMNKYMYRQECNSHNNI